MENKETVLVISVYSLSQIVNAWLDSPLTHLTFFGCSNWFHVSYEIFSGFLFVWPERLTSFSDLLQGTWSQFFTDQTEPEFAMDKTTRELVHCSMILNKLTFFWKPQKEYCSLGHLYYVAALIRFKVIQWLYCCEIYKLPFWALSSTVEAQYMDVWNGLRLFSSLRGPQVGWVLSTPAFPYGVWESVMWQNCPLRYIKQGFSVIYDRSTAFTMFT